MGHASPACVQARQFQRRLVCLRSRVAEKRSTHFGYRAKPRTERVLPLDAEHIRGVHQTARLIGNGCGYFRVRVAEIGYGNSRNRIEILAPVCVPKAGALPAGEVNRLPGIGMHQV